MELVAAFCGSDVHFGQQVYVGPGSLEKIEGIVNGDLLAADKLAVRIQQQYFFFFLVAIENTEPFAGEVLDLHAILQIACHMVCPGAAGPDNLTGAKGYRGCEPVDDLSREADE